MQVRRNFRDTIFVDKRIKDSLIDFYPRYVDDSLILLTEEDIDNIIK